jgi:glutamyl-tRNA synthetase
VAAELAAAGVPADLAPAFWAVVRENIATRAEIAGWWQVVSDGAEPLVAPEDEAFVAEALALLPPLPFGPKTWSEWTEAVKAKTGRKGKGLFMPLRKALTGRERGPEMADFLPLMRALPRARPGA